MTSWLTRFWRRITTPLDLSGGRRDVSLGKTIEPQIRKAKDSEDQFRKRES